MVWLMCGPHDIFFSVLQNITWVTMTKQSKKIKTNDMCSNKIGSKIEI